ncbi:MAG: hypothetical protein O3A95_03015 [Planctomycetota bacterium]|nr:hypothetical protein [Planctomycetota bacterium]MDA1113252.1 hypothetical protein [Planctomycetota bacterium]
MSPRILLAILCGALLVLPACGGKTKQPTEVISKTVSGSGPQVSANAPPPPNPPIPAADQTVFVAHIVDSVSGNPIGGVNTYLMREIPEPLYMRSPRRKTVVAEYRTPMHGQSALTADADGTMKWWLISGPGFDPFVTEAGNAVGGQTQEMTIRATIVPVCNFIVRLPNGDRADNAVCTMAVNQDQPVLEGKMSEPGSSSGNVGNTERADDFGKVAFNRAPGSYRLSFNASSGKYRHYQIFEWDGTQDKAVEIQLPANSMEKPW